MGYVAISNPITFVYGSNTIVLTGTLAPDSPLDYTPVIAGANRRNFYGQSLGFERYRGHSLGLTWSDVTADTAGSITDLATYTGMLQGTGFDTAVFGNQYANWYVEPGSLDVQMTGYNAYSCSFQLMSDLVAAAGTGTGTTPPVSPYIAASGGTETTVGTYKYHTFASSGTLTVTNGGTAEYLVVGGGAGGASFAGGGGGAGGWRTGSMTIGTGAYPITVGVGGTGAAGNKAPGGNGGDSIFSSITSPGGGGGGGGDVDNTNRNGQNGGCGGGGGCRHTYSSQSTGGTGSYGGNGGRGNALGYSGGGGGGANANGVDAPTSNNGGNGGAGKEWPSGSGTYRAGGGGGAGNSVAGSGGNGGGGAGERNGGAVAGNGSANTGGGGGGGYGQKAGDGGSGIVIIRYEIEAE